MKRILGNITKKALGPYMIILLTFLLLPALLFTTDIDILQSAIDFINND